MKEPNATTRRVWAYLSQPEHTQDSIREIAGALGLGYGTVTHHLDKLNKAGYVKRDERDKYKHRARVVIVPLIDNAQPTPPR